MVNCIIFNSQRIKSDATFFVTFLHGNSHLAFRIVHPCYPTSIEFNHKSLCVSAVKRTSQSGYLISNNIYRQLFGT